MPAIAGPTGKPYFRRQNQSWHEMFSPLIQYSVDATGPAAEPAHPPHCKSFRPWDV